MLVAVMAVVQKVTVSVNTELTLKLKLKLKKFVSVLRKSSLRMLRALDG